MTLTTPLTPFSTRRRAAARLVALPGVYRPQADTQLLMDALSDSALSVGAAVLDVFAGSGALAVTAAREGAGSVTTVDLSRRAVLSTWLNLRARRVPVRALHGGLRRAVAEAPFDVVIANPPYVPSASKRPPRGAQRAWEAGVDGRALLDPLCDSATELLAPHGAMLMVQSAVSGVRESLARLASGGLEASVVARARIPFGPVMRERVSFLESAGLIDAGQRHEDVVVIRADR